MPGCVELAAEESAGLPIDLNARIDEFLCRALRGEPASWDTLGAIDSEIFLSRCRHHGIVALLFHRLQESCTWHGWPPDLRHEFEKASKAGVAHDLLRVHYLKQLVSRLSERGIPCILLKGEALAASMYEQPGVRTRSDIDLFIRIQDILVVRHIMVELGYRIASPVYKSHQFTAVRPGDESLNIRFDIHWRMLNAPRFARVFSFEAVYRSAKVHPGVSPARILDQSNALMLACMHRFGNQGHDRDRLIWLYDIHLLVSAMSINDLTEFTEKAVRKNIQEACSDALEKCHQYLATAVPNHVLCALRSPAQPESFRSHYSYSQLALLMDDFRHLPGARSRFGFLREFFMPPADYLLFRYGKEGWYWVPVLYLRYLLGGFIDRATLR